MLKKKKLDVTKGCLFKDIPFYIDIHATTESTLIKEISLVGIFVLAFLKASAPNHLFSSNKLFSKHEF